MKFLGYFGVAIVVLILLAIPQLQYRKHPDTYFLITEDYDEYLEKMKEKEAQKA
jgi:ascorbate PTS system EIIC component